MLTVSVGLTITVIGLGLTALILANLARRRGKLLDRITQAQQRLPLAARSFPVQRQLVYHKPVIVMAHRGLARYGTENSGPAIQLAAMTGVNGIELDIRFTADHIPVLFHDRTLQRVNLTPQPIRDLTWSKLANIPIAPANRFLDLETFLAEYAAAYNHIMLDLKDFRTHRFD